jgi:aminopeptidase-like protein
MPIAWEDTANADKVGEESLALMRELFPLPRSLTGEGVRQTLDVLGREVPLDIVETPTGTPVFDWTVPDEWNLRGAWVEGPDGERLVDVADSSLHVLGYSTPIDIDLDLEQLRNHVYTHDLDPELVPYRTSYWHEQWGICMSRRQLESLKPGRYRVVIDSTLAPGSLTSGEVRIPGASKDEFLLSTYICHPALANDNLSGIVLLWALARALARQELRYTYRLLWSPGTLGPLCWLDRNRPGIDRIKHGLAVSCAGDPGPLRFKRSRRGDTIIDRAAANALARLPGSIVTDWNPGGGDERQFCSPGFDLALGTFSRTPHGLFPEYHSSADNLDLVTPQALGESFRAVLEIVDAVESNDAYVNLSPYGEPQLGRRGLYPAIPDARNVNTALLWVLSLSDGETDLLAISDRSGLPFADVRDAAVALEREQLVAKRA